MEACADEYAACDFDCLTEIANTQQCLIDFINELGYVTAENQSTCAEFAAADGVIITPEFNALFPCMMCDEQTADVCLGGFDASAPCP